MKPHLNGTMKPPTGAAGAHRPSPAGAARSRATGQSNWSRYWQEFGLENAPHDRCHVPGDGRQAVDEHWRQFADGLPGGAQVLDIGCGAGTAGRSLLDRRNDLEVKGIDLANVPIIGHRNLTIHRWVAMEDLPFGDSCFDGAISLFGIEYGNIVETARELARVLKPGARFSFLVHHRESEIVREGGARRGALRELIAGKTKAAFLAGDGAAVDQHRCRLNRQFPRDSTIDLVSNYFRRNIARSRKDRQALWQKLAGELDPEIALLGHLDRSAKSPAELGAWLGPLLSTMPQLRIGALQRRSGGPIAWGVSGIR